MDVQRRYAILVPADSGRRCEAVEIPYGEGELAALQKYVGGYIEVASVEALSGRKNENLLIVNEEGKLIGLPPNRRATELCAGDRGVSDIIVGDVLLIPGAFGEDFAYFDLDTAAQFGEALDILRH